MADRYSPLFTESWMQDEFAKQNKKDADSMSAWERYFKDRIAKADTATAERSLMSYDSEGNPTGKFAEMQYSDTRDKNPQLATEFDEARSQKLRDLRLTPESERSPTMSKLSGIGDVVEPYAQSLKANLYDKEIAPTIRGMQEAFSDPLDKKRKEEEDRKRLLAAMEYMGSR